jgi:hypothetical protein
VSVAGGILMYEWRDNKWKALSQDSSIIKEN